MKEFECRKAADSYARALNKVEVVSGVLEDECAKLLTDFFATKR